MDKKIVGDITMSNSQYNEKNEQDELQKYLEEKARQEQEQEIKKNKNMSSCRLMRLVC